MSAHIVEKETITKIMAGAMSRHILQGASRFSWYHHASQKSYEIGTGDLEKQAEIATMLWRENAKSVNHRYKQNGDIADYEITPADLKLMSVDPIQLIKSCDYLDYQSCEHEDWRESNAKAFLDSLRRDAVCALPGYSEAMWG